MMVSKTFAQDTASQNLKTAEISMGTFSTVYANSKVSASPAISGYYGDYYFESRYNYETANSASLNIGKKILKNLKHAEIIPMAGLIFGSFKGVTAELQTSLDYPKWSLSVDNQFSYDYTASCKSLYYNWSVARYKLSNNIRIGFTSFLDKHVNQPIVFDKGITVSVLFKQWSFRCYAYNYEIEKRYYWVGIRHTIQLRLSKRVISG